MSPEMFRGAFDALIYMGIAIGVGLCGLLALIVFLCMHVRFVWA